ncbi:MAG: hypothetical protein KJI71_00080 [Patescibacteria group bacterium]|nr:hypothetical protein [Patescibacteria group bacterium]
MLESIFRKLPFLIQFPLCIDLNNVARHRYNRTKNPRFGDIKLLLNHLNGLGFSEHRTFPICDPNLLNEIDKQNEFRGLLEEGIIIESSKVADEFILNFALKQEFCWIISMDNFINYYDQILDKNPYKWINDRKIEFMILKGIGITLSPNISSEKICELIANEISKKRI